MTGSKTETWQQRHVRELSELADLVIADARFLADRSANPAMLDLRAQSSALRQHVELLIAEAYKEDPS